MHYMFNFSEFQITSERYKDAGKQCPAFTNSSVNYFNYTTLLYWFNKGPDKNIWKMKPWPSHKLRGILSEEFVNLLQV